MAGNLIVDRVAKTPTGTTTDLVRGLSKAWLVITQATSPDLVRASFNISSVVDVGTGRTTANITSAMSSGNHVVSNGGNDGNITIDFTSFNNSLVSAYSFASSASTIGMVTQGTSANAYADGNHLTAVTHGDLA